MKTWEMIKELSENPEKKFESKTSGDRFAFVSSLGCIIVKDEYGNTKSSVLLNREWEEVKEPVTFIEAVRSGKRMKLVYSLSIHVETGYMTFKEMISYFSRFEAKYVREFMLEGKWYIK